MKPFLMLLLGFLSITPLWGQDVIAKMSEGTCECLKKRDISTKSADALQVELGLCLIEQIDANQKALKRAGYNTESTGIYEQLGQKIGINLALNCPEFMQVLGTMMRDENSDFKDKVIERIENIDMATGTADLKSQLIFLGEVKAVEYGDFIKLVLKNGDDKRKDFYWINSFKGDDALIAMESLDQLIGKQVEITYLEDEVYFHKLKAYLGINRIAELQMVQ